MTRPRLEVADVFRTHGDAFLDLYGDVLSPEQRRALSDIAACRTAALGGHVEDAFTRLVNLVARTSEKDREKARDHLLGLFAAVGNDDPRVLAGRRNLASALF